MLDRFLLLGFIFSKIQDLEPVLAPSIPIKFGLVPILQNPL
jgi:hypothetical protein